MLTVLENYKTQLREILKDHPDSLKILDSIHDPLELYYFSRFEEGKDPKAMGPIIQGLSEYLHRLNIIAQEINRLEPEEFWQLIRSNKSNPMGNAAMTGVMVEQPETLKYAVSQLQTALKRHPFSVFLAEPRHRELSVALDVIQDSQGRTFSRTMVRVYPFAKDDKIKQKQGVHGFPELKGIYHNLQLKDEFMPPSGTIGQITFFIILDKDGHAVLVFEENQPSYGFRHIKPSSAQKPYFIWVEALQKHIIGLAKQIGINQIYALSRDAISQVYLYNHTSTSTHFDPYKRPYREPYWQPKMVDVSTIYPFWPPGKQISVWEYVNPAMKAPGEKGGDGAMKTFEDFIREASNHALSYEEAEKFYEIWLGSKPKIPNIFWRYSKTIVNYVLVVLDRNIEGFRTAREIEDKTERVKKMAELYREYVIRHPGQKAFYTEKGGLYNLIDKLKHSPAELLLFVIDHGALKGLVDENNEYALKPWEIRTRNYPWTEDKLGKAATNAIIWYVPGFEKAMVEGNREEMVNLVSQVVLDHKGQNIGFFADVGGLKGLTNPHLGLTAYGITTTLLRLAVKYDSRLEGLRNSSILDRAMILDKATHMEHQNLPGGIDLTSDKALSVQNNDQGIKFHIDPAQLEQLQNAPGFVPVIINIQPLKSLSGFLGLNQTAPQAQLNHK